MRAHALAATPMPGRLRQATFCLLLRVNMPARCAQVIDDLDTISTMMMFHDILRSCR